MNFARASHFFCTFLSNASKTSKCLISLFKEDVNKQRRNCISLSELRSRSLEIQLQEGLPTFDKVSW